ncbi:MAG: glutamate racemase [Anaerolineae bacterium]|nr:glutamate racemase [Anaerolineae bacterium]
MKAKNLLPIGIFDSGIGGLTVWREVVRQFPHESTVYFADQGHVPYGAHTLEEVRGYAAHVARFLLEQDTKLIVVACNAASGAALHYLREKFPEVPLIGMEPAIKPAVEHTRTGAVGVIVAPVTLQGDLFQRLTERFAANASLHAQGCPGLVEAIEAGALDTPETEKLLRQYLAPLLAAGIDQLVLGCTHYPFLAPTIRRITGPGVALIDPAPAVVRQMGRVLAQHGLNAPEDADAHHQFFTSSDAATLARQAQTLVGYNGNVESAPF